MRVGLETHLDIVKNALNVEDDEIKQLNQQDIINVNESIKKLEGNVFVCYHGNTSKAVVNYLEKFGIGAYSPNGGVTSIVGEIF